MIASGDFTVIIINLLDSFYLEKTQISYSTENVVLQAQWHEKVYAGDALLFFTQ